MAYKQIDSRIKMKIDTAANWSGCSETLYDGELVVERVNTDTIKIKCGNGTDTYSALPYVSPDVLTDSEINAILAT